MSFFRKLIAKDDAGNSLQSQMQRLDDLENLLQETLTSYRASMDSIAEHTPRLPKEPGEEHKRQIKRLRGGLDDTPTKGTLADTRKGLDSQLDAYNKQLEGHLEHQENEAKEVMAIVAVMAESIGSRDKQYNVRFRGIAKKLRILTTSTDLSEIKRRLTEEIGQLEKYVDEMARDTVRAVERVRAELQSVRTRVNPLAAGEATDAATGLPGRVHGLTAIEGLSRAEVRFCLLWLGIEDFPDMLGAYGPDVSNAVLEQFGGVIKDSFQPADLVCRWGEAEFLVISDGRLPQIAGRMGAIEKNLTGPYRVSTPAGRKEIQVGCATTLVESLSGESSNQIVTRLSEASRAAVPSRGRA